MILNDWNMIRALYIHGYNGSGYTGEAIEKIAKAQGIDIKVFTEKFDKNPTEILKKVKTLIRTKDINLLIASSYGAFIALQITNLFKIVINPCLFPSIEIPKLDSSFRFVDECKKLERLDIGSFNTELVKDMSFMFCKCERLTEINVSHFKTDQVENMEAMFCRCGNLRKLEVSGFDTRKATNMKDMFSFCENLTQLDTSNFYYAPNVNVEGMFKECGASKDNTVPDFARKQKTLYVFNGEEMDKRENRRHYIGNSIEEICQNFLSYKDNKSINNGQGKVRNTLNISDSDKIYLIHDDSWFSRGKNGFAITDKGIYTKYLYYDKSKVFIPWEMLKKAKAIDVKNNSVRIDEIAIAFNYKNSRDNSNLWELVRLFDSIRAFLKRTF